MSDEERMSDQDSDQEILGLIYPVVSKVLESQALGRRFMPFPHLYATQILLNRWICKSPPCIRLGHSLSSALPTGFRASATFES